VAGAHYEIVVRGRLGCSLSRWFREVEVHSAGPDATCLRGWYPDQAALQGTLARLGDFGIELSSVRRLPDDAV
jgi:hypothetical protein